MYRILVVEDDKDIRNNLKIFLVYEGYKVLTAVNGATAYNITLKNRIDVIISDIQMPVMNGLELLQKLKDNPQTSNIPVIIVTGCVEIQNVKKTILAGANDFLYKPFDFNDILERVETHINKNKNN